MSVVPSAPLRLIPFKKPDTGKKLLTGTLHLENGDEGWGWWWWWGGGESQTGLGIGCLHVPHPATLYTPAKQASN